MGRKFAFGIMAKMIILFSVLFVSMGIAMELVHFYGVPFTGLKGSNYYVRENVLREFSAIADMQKIRILNWVSERKKDVVEISESAKLKEYLNAISALTRSYKEQGKDEGEVFRALQKEKAFTDLIDELAFKMKTYADYEELVFMDRNSGIIVASTEKANIGKKLFGTEHLLDSVDPDGTSIGIFSIHASHSGTPDLVVARPIRSKNGPGDEGADNIIILGGISMTEKLMPLIREVEGLGHTGEIVMVKSDGRVLLPLKHTLKDGRIAKPFEYQVTAEPSLRAARGEEGVIEDLDYRGVPVLAAYRSLRLSAQEAWGMVVKRDRKEVFYYQRQIGICSIITLLVSLLIGILLIAMISRNITWPVRQMAEMAGHIEANDFSVKANVKTHDEIGFLAESFNSMIAQIRSWKEELEAKVQSRTAELNAANQQLRASEQQLKASNQQLRASQQQLRANNEQLAANEKRLQIEIENRERIERGTQKHLEELQVFFKASVDREERIIELKNKVKELEEGTNKG